MYEQQAWVYRLHIVEDGAVLVIFRHYALISDMKQMVTMNGFMLHVREEMKKPSMLKLCVVDGCFPFEVCSTNGAHGPYETFHVAGYDPE